MKTPKTALTAAAAAAVVISLAACGSSPGNQGPHSRVVAPLASHSATVDTNAGNTTPTTAPSTTTSEPATDRVTETAVETVTSTVTNTVSTTSTPPWIPTSGPVVTREIPTSGSVAPPQSSSAWGTKNTIPEISTTTSVDPAGVDYSNPSQVAAAFITAWSEVQTSDSMGDNNVLRSSAWATERLTQEMMSKLPDSLPVMLGAGGRLDVHITDVNGIYDPRGAGDDTVLARVEYTVDTYEQGKKVSVMEGAARNCVLKKQPDGRWLVDELKTAAS